jgi:hypothetical protein
MAGGQNQVSRDQGSATEIAACRFQLADGFPGLAGGISDRFAIVFPKEQGFDVSGTWAFIVIICVGIKRKG